MGQRITTGTECSLYDSVTGFAFGPVFRNRIIAEQFIAFAEKCGYRAGDIRMLSDNVIEELWDSWNNLCERG